MPGREYPHHRKATQMLLLATVFWGVSFPTMKALALAQQEALPEAGSWFISALDVCLRFGLAAILMLFICLRTLRSMTRLELWQGGGLALFGGAGILFQMDGLAYTEASTSAFLTQFYCLLLPFIVALRDRARPSGWLILCSVLVIAGVAILAQIDWKTLKMDRGEWETLIGSLFFTGQILWLERPLFARNNVNHFSLIMFAGMALMTVPIIALSMNSPRDLAAAVSVPGAGVCFAILVLVCTMGAYLMMNYWQPHVPAQEAGLIYTVEPVFASLFALFLPAWFSVLAGIEYANERPTAHLLAGGGLITLANVLLQLKGGQSSSSPRD